MSIKHVCVCVRDLALCCWPVFSLPLSVFLDSGVSSPLQDERALMWFSSSDAPGSKESCGKLCEKGVINESWKFIQTQTSERENLLLSQFWQVQNN